MVNNTPTPGSVVNTGQRSNSGPNLLCDSSGTNYLTWSGIITSVTSAQFIDFAWSSSFDFSNQSQVAAWNTGWSAASNVAAVMSASGNTMYLFWADGNSNAITFTAVNYSSSTSSWSFSNTTQTIPGSNVDSGSGPSVDVMMVAGLPCIVVVWMDANKGAMTYAYVTITQSVSIPVSLGVPCVGVPCIESCGPSTLLAWTDTNGHMNMVVDPSGGMNFNFNNTIPYPSAGNPYSSTGLAITLLPTLDSGYITWIANNQGMFMSSFYQDINNNWQFTGGANPVPTGVASFNGGPAITTFNSTVSGVTQTQLVLGWTTGQQIQTLTYSMA